MKISDTIERFIREMLAEDESIELKRNDWQVISNVFRLRLIMLYQHALQLRGDTA